MTLDVLHAEYAGGGPGFVLARLTLRAYAPEPCRLAPPALLIADGAQYRRLAAVTGTPSLPAGPSAPVCTVDVEVPLHLTASPAWWVEPGPTLPEPSAGAGRATTATDDLRRRLAELTAEVAALRAHVAQTAPSPAAIPAPPPAAPRSRLRPTLPAVLVTLGALAVADAVATVVWQEPLSALWAHHEQAALTGQLHALDRRLAATTPRDFAPHATPQDRMAELARTLDADVHAGRALGELRIPRIHAHDVVVQGTSASSLSRGPGHYAGTPLPGEPGTVGIAGHRTTYGAPFRHIDALRRGDTITLTMPYGEFVYRVQRTRIVLPSDVSVLRATGTDGLALTACHPLYSAAKRIVVLARLQRATPRGPAAPANPSAAIS